MQNPSCPNIRMSNMTTWVALIILSGLVLLIPVNSWSEERETVAGYDFYAKFGFDLGFPFGLPGIHVETGHAILAAFVGAGLSAPCVIHDRFFGRTDEPEVPYSIVLSLGAVATPVPSTWPLRPRVLVLYTNESVYFNYHAHNFDHHGWTTFHKERFPGLCVLVELELNLQKMGLPAYQNTPNFRIELGYGINKPSAGWDAIERLERDVANRIRQEPDYYDSHCCMSGGNFHHILRVAFSWRFGIKGK